MQREKSKAAKVLLIISIVFLAITLCVTYYRYAKIQRAIFTTGKIVGFTEKIEEKKEKKRTKTTTFYYPEFEFKDKAGKLINVKSNAGKGNSPAYNIGEEIEIMYSPDNSSDAQINDFSSLWLPTFVLGAFTLIFSFVTYVVRKKQY
ncbi:DUF3592 domain-containing protein [Flavobacterium sp. DGU38]|uniref:DUF3592 domain-containing protein n=1 Tax=Flavobacterium calami TaxID=3139144 RepID=A0ABU9ISA7_9FLAO